MVILNLDNDEKRQLVEHCYRTQKVLINPMIDWDDEFLWWYIKHEGIEINPLYGCGWERVGCIGCPMAGKQDTVIGGLGVCVSRIPPVEQNRILIA